MIVTKYIPDAITSMNLVCGSLGVIAAFGGRPDVAFFLMIAAAVFDFCDGFAARALGAYSDLGKELDSLCDMVSFGLLPSVMMMKCMYECRFGQSWVCLMPLLITVFSAARLAKFNIDPRQSHGFIGLPTPACAILCASLCYFIAAEPASFLASWAAGNWFIPICSAVLSFLLIAEIPMFSLKFSRDDEKSLKQKRICFLVNCILCAVIVLVLGLHWVLIPLLVFLMYILMNIVFDILSI